MQTMTTVEQSWKRCNRARPRLMPRQAVTNTLDAGKSDGGRSVFGNPRRSASQQFVPE